MDKPNYYAILPANVRYDKNLKPNVKLLYAEITALSQSTGKCFASNQYFADLYNVTPIAISRWVSDLVKNGYIKREMEYKKGTKQIINRYISIGIDPINNLVNTPIDQKVKDNNTSSYNITSINNNEYEEHFNKLWLMYPSSRRPDSKKKVTAKIKKELKEITVEEWGRVIDRYRLVMSSEKYMKHCFRFMNNETFKSYLDAEYKDSISKPIMEVKF